MKTKQAKVGTRVEHHRNGGTPGEIVQVLRRKNELLKVRVLWEGGQHEWIHHSELNPAREESLCSDGR